MCFICTESEHDNVISTDRGVGRSQATNNAQPSVTMATKSASYVQLVM